MLFVSFSLQIQIQILLSRTKFRTKIVVIFCEVKLQQTRWNDKENYKRLFFLSEFRNWLSLSQSNKTVFFFFFLGRGWNKLSKICKAATNPPYGPHFGGACERLIQIAKRTILIILGSRKLTLVVFQTISAETEMILNSRPLTIVTDYPENDEPLTPNHFLIQRPFSSLPPGVIDDSMPLTYTKWTHVQQMMNHLWKRLKKEYLPSLMKRPKWNETQPPLKVGDIVWVLKDLTPRGIWPIGRVVEEHPGRDGTTRVVTVRTSHGTLNRPATALVKVFWFFCNAFCAVPDNPGPR